MSNEQIQQNILPEEIYDQDWKYLFNTKIKVEKRNNIDLWSNTRFLIINEGMISYRNLDTDPIKKQVDSKHCRIIESKFNQQDYSFQIQFQESNLMITSSKINNQNSQKNIIWKFLVKDQQEKVKLMNKKQYYEEWEKTFQAYIEANGQTSLEKKEQFYKSFFDQCKNLITNNQITEEESNRILKISRIRDKGELQYKFKQYKRLFSIIQKCSVENLIPPLIIMIIDNNRKYLCELGILGCTRDIPNNNGIQEQWKLINDINQNQQKFLSLFELRTYSIENKKGFGMLFLIQEKDKSDLQIEQLDQTTQIQCLEQQEIYDSIKLSNCIHQNQLKINQLGQIVKKTSNNDIKKICKVDMIARSAKQFFQKKQLNLDLLNLQNIIPSFFGQYQSYDCIDYLKGIFENIQHYFKEELQDKDPQIIQVLLLNSLMFHLNFYVPLKAQKMLNEINNTNILKFIDFTNMQTLNKLQTYEGSKQMGLNELQMFNDEFIKNYQQKNLNNKPLECFQYAKLLMGPENLIFAEQLKLYSQNKDQIFLVRALECVKNVHKTSKKIQEFQQKLTIRRLILNDQQFKNDCQQVLSPTKQKELINDITLMFYQENSTMNESKLHQISDEEKLVKAVEKKEKKNYADVLKLLEFVQQKSDFLVLKLGFETETKVSNLPTYQYSNQLLNYIFLYSEGSKEQGLVKDILMAVSKRYLMSCTQIEIQSFKKLSQINLEQRFFQFSDYFNDLKNYFIQNNSSIEQYVCQQFDYLVPQIQFFSILNDSQLNEYFNNHQSQQEFNQAIKFVSFVQRAFLTL